ncbi:hypothetical protein [Candidatus Tisiphia endosymbiont of Parasteatoda lunata]|uniref:hypothetical protein n=1 Tax=Candidatus Tisiphia endosymbiont of Parasteatoda lunata TaxID=3066275 RepID=UPI003977A3AD
MEVTTIGIDIAKRIFQIHGVDKNGKTILKKKLMREQVLTFMANVPKCLVGMEACGGASYWARELVNHSALQVQSLILRHECLMYVLT